MSIATGDVSGIMESHHDNEPLGDSAIGTMSIMVSNKGIVMGNVNWLESVSLSTADPTAANRDA